MFSDKVQERQHHVAHSSAEGWHVTDMLKRVAFPFVLTVTTVTLIGIIIVSPLALRQLGSLRGINWTQLSNIGQTYGATSALLTGLALIGVAASMVFQVRAILVSREQSSREHHAHLVEMTLAEPLYARSWGVDPAAYGSLDRYRQQIYVNLIISFWENDYRLGGFQERALHIDAADLFRGEAGREFWAQWRTNRLETSESRRNRRFWRILDEEYWKAIAAGPPAVQSNVPSMAPPESQQSTLPDPIIKTGATLLLGAIGGIAFGTFWRRKNRN